MNPAQLYRQNEDGSLEPVEQSDMNYGVPFTPTPGRRGAVAGPHVIVPEARGKAEAYDSWAAQSGRINPKTGKYHSGPLRGKTYDQAMQQFDRMWRSAPDSIKEKYASLSANRPYTDLAPSERKIQGLTPAMPKDMSAAGMQQRRMQALADQQSARMGKPGPLQAELDKRKTSTTPARPPAGNSTLTPPKPKPTAQGAPKPKAGGDMTAEAMGTPEQQAQVQAMMNEGQDFATASTNNSDMAAAIAMDKYKGRPVSAPVEKTPIESAIDSAVDANTRFWDRTTKAVNSAVMAPFTPESERIVGAESEAARRALEAKKAAEADAAQKRLTEENAAKLRKERGLPAPTPATTPSATPAPTPVAAATGVPPLLARPEAGTTPATPATPARINRLTGLPFGYRPGDDVPAANQAAADASVRRQIAADPRMQAGGAVVQGPSKSPLTGSVMTPTPRTVTTPVRPPTALEKSGINRPRTLPPGTNTVEGRQGAALQRFKRMEENPSTVNPPGLRLGPKRPLTELVTPRIGPTPERPSVGLPGAQSAPNRTVATPMRDASARLDYGRPAPKQLVTSITRPQFAMARR